MIHLNTVATQIGLPLNNPSRAYNTRLAQEMGKWAEEQGKGDEFNLAAFQSYFVKTQDISNSSVLIDLAESIGLSREEAKHTIENRMFREEVDADWSYSKKMMVTAVPTFLVNQKKLVGAQSYEALKKFMLDSHMQKR